jgi:hypothetical protein
LATTQFDADSLLAIKVEFFFYHFKKKYKTVKTERKKKPYDTPKIWSCWKDYEEMSSIKDYK